MVGRAGGTFGLRMGDGMPFGGGLGGRHLVHNYFFIYLPHKVVAEVFNYKEPIGRGCMAFNWFENNLMLDLTDFNC